MAAFGSGRTWVGPGECRHEMQLCAQLRRHVDPVARRLLRALGLRYADDDLFEHGVLLASPTRDLPELAPDARTDEVGSSCDDPTLAHRRTGQLWRALPTGRVAPLRRSRSRRGQLLSDTLAACKVLWRDTPAALDTPTVSFRDIYCEPKPLQPGGVPLWIGGTLHGPNLRRLVEWGDAWIPIMGATLDDIADGTRRIRAAWSTAGRDPAALQVQAPLRIERGDDGRPDLARSIAGVADLVTAGATDVHVTLRAFNRDPADAPAVFAEIVRRFADAVA